MENGGIQGRTNTKNEEETELNWKLRWYWPFKGSIEATNLKVLES